MVVAEPFCCWKHLGMEGRDYNLVSFILGTGSA